jgi:hypothetical protein
MEAVRPMRSIPAILIVLLVLVACSPAAAPSPTTNAWILVVADGGSGDDPGMSVADALTHGPTDDLVSVSGALFVDPDGTVRLCDAIAESFPPQCGGASIEVTDLDLSTVADLQEGNGVRWAESVVLFGSVEAG